MTPEEKKRRFFESHMTDLYHRAEEKNYPVFTDFLTTGECIFLKEHFPRKKENNSGVSVFFYGGNEDCTRVIAGFIPSDYQAYGIDLFPVRCIKIRITDYRHGGASLTHRDFLGSVLGLGLDRSVIGDIRFREDTVFLFCKEEFTDLILHELSVVKHSPVECSLLADPTEIPPQEYEVSTRTIASLRLDNVVSAMMGTSRSRAVTQIQQGKVVVDSVERDSVSYPCRDGNIISIRHYGKYRLQVSEDAVTKKGKQRIQIYKYK